MLTNQDKRCAAALDKLAGTRFERQCSRKALSIPDAIFCWQHDEWHQVGRPVPIYGVGRSTENDDAA